MSIEPSHPENFLSPIKIKYDYYTNYSSVSLHLNVLGEDYNFHTCTAYDNDIETIYHNVGIQNKQFTLPVFNFNCNKINTQYYCTLSLRSGSTVITTGDIFILNIGNPLLTCVQPEIKTIKLEHDFVKSYNVTYNFKKSTGGDDNPAMAQFLTSFSDCHVNMTFTNPDVENPEADNNKFDCGNDAVTMTENLVDYVKNHWTDRTTKDT